MVLPKTNYNLSAHFVTKLLIIPNNVSTTIIHFTFNSHVLIATNFTIHSNAHVDN